MIAVALPCLIPSRPLTTESKATKTEQRNLTGKLTEALVQRYPDHGMLIGAKVAKGGMAWG